MALSSRDQGRYMPRPAKKKLPSSPAFDRERALQHVDGNAPLLADLLADFAARSPVLLRSLAEGIARRDRKVLKQEIEELGGVLEILGAVKAQETAKRMEDLARAGDLDGACALGPVLLDDLRAFIAAVRTRGQRAA
jgi:HPt (histidine-containing phosphotransfer) domain-containing protein